MKNFIIVLLLTIVVITSCKSRTLFIDNEKENHLIVTEQLNTNFYIVKYKHQSSDELYGTLRIVTDQDWRVGDTLVLRPKN